jgi:NADP-dependent 3-hydroxy acid dehydrogenase YdfG
MGMSNIADKVVVITGANGGIGESTAKLLAQQGARVVLGARRSNRIDAVVQEISAAGGKAIGFATDATKRAEVEALIQGAVDGFGRVDVLLNNAGAQAPLIRPGTNTSFGPLKRVNAGVLSIAYAEAGPADGPPVLLLHGWP